MNKEETKQSLIKLGLHPNRFKGEKWDLSEIDFSEMNIVGMDLSELDLSKTHFGDANLCDVNLTGTPIVPAQLEHARNLDYAILEPGRLADVLTLRLYKKLHYT